MKWTDDRVRSALGLGAGDPATEYRRIWTDTRTIGPGDLFVALCGETFDGHSYLESARELGATGAVVRRGTPPLAGLHQYQVDDTLVALGVLARARRRSLTGPVIAITGTNGKTSTKEMLAAALATRYRVHATRANRNNLIGVPLTILEAGDEVEALVVEAGANQPGEIARYREIIEPTLTVITNVAAGHLEGFGSLEGVLEEKLALARDVAVAVVGIDEPRLLAGARKLARQVVSGGLTGADVVPERVEIDPTGRPRLAVDGMEFTLGLLGLHQAKNAMLVWAVAKQLRLDLAEVARALEAITLPAGRGQLIHHGSLTILNDCYNANPTSFRAAIEVAQSLRRGRRLVFVAGTMLELGPEHDRYHREIASELIRLDPDVLVGVGEFASVLVARRDDFPGQLIVGTDPLAVVGRLAAAIRPTDVVVLKGSRGMALERIIPALLNRTH